MVGTVLALVVTIPPARAASPGCALASHCYSVLRPGSREGTLFAGIYGTWNRAAMISGCASSDHRWMNSTMWFWPFSEGWVEGGHTAGWLRPGGNCDYFAYAAWQKEDGTGYDERMIARLDHNDNLTDEFQISRSSSTNVFRVYFNGGRVTTANVQFWNSRRMQLGGEVATSSGTSNRFSMIGRAITQSGTKVLMPGPQVRVVDDPPLYGSSPANSSWIWRVR